MTDPASEEFGPAPVPIDGDVRWIEETVVDRAAATPTALRRSSVLGAAMIAVGEILEPEKARVDIEIQAEAPAEPYDLPFTVDFGGLPELS